MADLGPWLLMALVMDVVNTQLVPDLIDFNYPYAAAGAYPKLTFGAVSNQELLELLQLVTGAQQAGLTPSKKYYAKALSIQQADPNDPDDAMTPGGAGGMGGMMGGHGRRRPVRGGRGRTRVRAPAPTRRLRGRRGGGFGGFSERATRNPWETFAGGSWHTGKAGGKYWLPQGKQDVAENRLYGKAGEQAEAAYNSTRARVGRTVGRAARGTNTGLGKVQAASATATKAALWTAGRVGAGLKRLGWLERRLGLGKAIETEVRRRRARVSAVADAARRGGAVSGAREAAVRAYQYRVDAARRIRRKYGLIPAVIAEAVMWAASKFQVAFKALSSVGTKGASNVVGAVVRPMKEFLGSIFAPVFKKAVEFPAKVATRNIPGLMKTARDKAKLAAYRQSEYAFADEGGGDAFLQDLREDLDNTLAIHGQGPAAAHRRPARGRPRAARGVRRVVWRPPPKR
jgi:hypothetical protein